MRDAHKTILNRSELAYKCALGGTHEVIIRKGHELFVSAGASLKHCKGRAVAAWRVFERVARVSDASCRECAGDGWV